MAELPNAKVAPAFKPAEQVGLKPAAPDQQQQMGREQSVNVHAVKHRNGDRWLPNRRESSP